jgi:TRAP-type C4-dicarboxylate transport system substrate-binding protein
VGLTEAQQAALLEAAEGDAKSNFRQTVEDEEEQLRGDLEEAGMTVVVPDRDAFIEQVEGLVEEEFPGIADLHATATGTG